jgi:hypothetical protein
MVLHRARQVLAHVDSSQRDYLASGAIGLEDTQSADGTTGLHIPVAQPPHRT